MHPYHTLVHFDTLSDGINTAASIARSDGYCVCGPQQQFTVFSLLQVIRYDAGCGPNLEVGCRQAYIFALLGLKVSDFLLEVLGGSVACCGLLHHHGEEGYNHDLEAGSCFVASLYLQSAVNQIFFRWLLRFLVTTALLPPGRQYLVVLHCCCSE